MKFNQDVRIILIIRNHGSCVAFTGNEKRSILVSNDEEHYYLDQSKKGGGDSEFFIKQVLTKQKWWSESLKNSPDVLCAINYMPF